MERSRNTTVIGLDLSLRATGMVAIPPGWRPGRWVGLPCATVGEEVEEQTAEFRVKRLAKIVKAVFDFVADAEGLRMVVVEDHAFGLASRGGVMLSELHGAVKHELYARGGWVVEPVNNMTARKYLLGSRMPRKGAAQEAIRVLKAAGCPWESVDEMDAFVVAQAARAQVLGLPGFALPVFK